MVVYTSHCVDVSTGSLLVKGEMCINVNYISRGSMLITYYSTVQCWMDAVLYCLVNVINMKSLNQEKKIKKEKRRNQMEKKKRAGSRKSSSLHA